MMRSCLVTWTWSVMVYNGICSPAIYQIELTQKGPSQYAEYDVSVPPLSEFTLCTWLRTSDFTHNQAIFTYLVNGNHALISLWLEAGGANLHTKLGRGAETITPVDWRGGLWRHLCMTWQSHSGAWALYQDGKLLACEASDKIVGYVFPGGGRILLGAADKIGRNKGWEGGFYDFIMILASTMSRNNSHRQPAHLADMPKKKTLENGNFKYIIIGRLQTENDNDVSNSKIDGPTHSKGPSFVRFRTPYSHVEHDVGLDLEMLPPVFKKIKHNTEIVFKKLNEPEFLDMHTFNAEPSGPSKMMSKLWSIINKAGKIGNFKTEKKISLEQFKTGTENLPVLSEFETPPPPSEAQSFELPVNDLFEMKPPDNDPPQNFNSPAKGDMTKKVKSTMQLSKYDMHYEPTTMEPLPTLNEMETPPSSQKDKNVYGHWTGGTFAGTVLGFLKNKNFNFKSVPKTIPHRKISDAFPYASEQKLVTTLPLRMSFKYKDTPPSSLDVVKRHVRSPEINVQIMNQSLRRLIAQQHAKEHAVNVEVLPRGEISSSFEEESQYVLDNQPINSRDDYPQPFSLTNHNMEAEFDTFADTPKHSEEEYFSYASGNKWHNIKTFNNDFINSNRYKYKLDTIEDNIFSDNLNSQSLPRLSFQHTPPDVEARELNKNRAIAYEVSKMTNGADRFVNRSPKEIDFMTNSNSQPSIVNKTKDHAIGPKLYSNKLSNNRENTFYKAVKLGNALNERVIIGKGVGDKKKSFVGGDDKIPDIHRYRSEIDDKGGEDRHGAPPSLRARVCEQTVAFENRLYAQADGGLDLSQAYSTIKIQNPAFKLLEDHYSNKCADRSYSSLQYPLMLVRWKETPIRLFGGADLRSAAELCFI